MNVMVLLEAPVAADYWLERRDAVTVNWNLKTAQQKLVEAPSCTAHGLVAPEHLQRKRWQDIRSQRDDHLAH